jgi:putative glutathione S-transferase
MGQLVEGFWRDQWYDTASTGGEFKRENASFRSWITADGAPGPSGEGGFRAEPGRYHLYVSYACPWAHRSLIMRSLKGLEEMIGLSVVHWRMRENG